MSLVYKSHVIYESSGQTTINKRFLGDDPERNGRRDHRTRRSEDQEDKKWLQGKNPTLKLNSKAWKLPLRNTGADLNPGKMKILRIRIPRFEKIRIRILEL